MVLIFEPWAKNVEHLEFNKNFFKIINKKYKNLYIGDINQIENITKEVKEIDYIVIEVKKDSRNKISRIKNLMNDLKNCYICKKIAKENNVKKIYITTAFPEIIFFTKILLRKYEVTYIMHSYLKYVEADFNFFKITSYMKILLKNFNHKKKYIVLGKGIYKNLLKIIPEIKNNLEVMNHPYSKIENLNLENQKKSKIKVGTVGVGSREKNTQYLFEIEKYIKEKNITNIELYHIGKLEKDLLPRQTEVCIPMKEKMLSQKEYDLYINELDYILYFYPKESYSLVASGAIFDSIFRYKNILAIKNDYFEEIFSKDTEISCLYDSLEEIKEEIIKISKKENHQVNQEAYNKIIEKYLVENIEIDGSN